MVLVMIVARRGWVSPGSPILARSRFGLLLVDNASPPCALSLSLLCHSPSLTHSHRQHTTATTNRQTYSMHIAIAITIAITLAAALAPLQQAHGWAQSCADGNTDVCCHLEQIGWKIDTLIEATMTIRPDRSYCDPWAQSVYDETIPRMCATDCWGGAVGLEGSWGNMATQADVLRTACKVNYFINGTCPAQQSSSSSTADAFSSTASASVSSTASASVSSTASASVSSTASAPASSTASATESSSTATNDGGAGASAPLGPAAEDSVGAAAPQTRAHWAFALACALMLIYLYC